ncbi:MAG: SEL1-like repeat protein [Bacteroidaceae bacterium]|nr:SEL1-like repeat protein [Bacteroidaceae bacterium]
MRHLLCFLAGFFLIGFGPLKVAAQKSDYIKNLTTKANQGDTSAQNNLGLCYRDGKQGVAQDYYQAAFWFSKAAEQGYADAQNDLGVCYYNGQGVAQDYSKAVYWYTKAAEQGNKYAQSNLGGCYQSGQGVAKDFSKAVYWYTKAAEQGNAWSQYNLGNCYEYGVGVRQDYSQVKKWYTKAAANGNTDAKKRIEGLQERKLKSQGYSDVTVLKKNGSTYYKVCNGGLYGLLSAEGKVIIPTEMEDLKEAGGGYLKFKVNGFWGVMNYQGTTIIPSSRGYTSIGNYISSQKSFPYTMLGYKGECDYTGKELSRIKTATPQQQAKTTSQTSTTSNQQNTQTQQRQPVPMQVWAQCASCLGSGLCHICHGGRGQLRDGSCFVCGYSGRCTYCAGQGGHYEIVYQ